MPSFKAIAAEIKSIEQEVEKGLKSTEKFLVHVSADKNLQTVVEAVTSATFGASAVQVEVAIFALADKAAEALTLNEAAFTAGLKNAGLDVQTIEAFKAVAKAAAGIKLGK